MRLCIAESFLAAGPPAKRGGALRLDNEEVGSGTKQGAGSTFLKDTLARIVEATGGTREDTFRAMAGSFMVSADNAHAVHPNFPEKTDDTNRPYMNEALSSSTAPTRNIPPTRSPPHFQGHLSKGRRPSPELCQPVRYGRRLHPLAISQAPTPP